ncbi:MAG: M67 family metallopeptidase [Thermoplasmata archaeon]
MTTGFLRSPSSVPVPTRLGAFRWGHGKAPEGGGRPPETIDGLLRPIVLGPQVGGAIVRAARAAYPSEACGLLLGWDRGGARCAARAIALANRDIEKPGRRFLIDPSDWSSWDHRADREGWSIQGDFHSHPDGTSHPSEEDLDAFWPTYVHGIVPVDATTVGPLAIYALDPATRQAIRIPVRTGRSP